MDTGILIQRECRSSLSPDDHAILTWVNAAFSGKTPSNLTICIVDSQAMQAMNLLYRQKDYPTNVLSFPNQLDPDLPIQLLEEIDQNHLGDIAICADVVEEEAAKQSKELFDHWAHIVIHGVLHLQGYDHEEDAEAEEMESLERKILSSIGIDDPY